MKQTIWLVLTRNGVQRMTKKPPYLDRQEIGVQLSLNVPDGAFKAPVIVAQVEVPEAAVAQPVIELTVEEYASLAGNDAA